MLRATLQEAVPLQVLAADGRTDLYAKVKLYSGDTPLVSLDLTHIDGGLYGTTYTPDAEGWLSAVYQLFEDSARTVPADYDLESETIEVSSDKTNILRILGLLHHNAIVDEQAYNQAGKLTSARVRAWRTTAGMEIQDPSELLFVWRVLGVYTNGRLTDFRIKDEP